MNYPETLSYLLTRLPMYSRIGAAAYKADLDNITALCSALGNPQNKFRSVHVAGTNGKGSCSHMLAAVLQSAGYKVGLHTSPHVHEFRERIRVNGEMVAPEFVVSFTEDIRPQIEKLNPSFFELSVAMAFEYFSQVNVDIAIIETGLGGRLDSTNIIRPELAVITNIGWDHMNLLGNTLQKIAGEKAGIIKPGIPVVVGETIPETLEVFTGAASSNGSTLYLSDHLFEVMEWKWNHHHLEVQVAEKGKTDHLHIELDLGGLYQLKNLVTVLTALHVLRNSGWVISEAHIFNGLRSVRKLTGLYGRWEVTGHDPLVVLDVAHNTDGMRQLMAQIEITDHHELHMIIGVVNDKETSVLLSLLPVTASYYFTQASIPRAKPAVELQQEALHFGLKGLIYPDVNEAIRSAKDRAAKNDLILVCGSIFLVAEVRS